MRIINILILCLMFVFGLFIGCSTFTPVIKDSELKPFIKSFIRDMNLELDALDGYTVKFESLNHIKLGNGDFVVGQCNYIPRVITIDPTFWYDWRLSNRRKRMLIYHELAHCYCYIMHNKELKEDGCPEDIMYPSLPRDSCVKKHEKEYIDKLFNKCGEKNKR